MSKKVFFLGAGFSKAINDSYPLMKDLTKSIQQELEKGSLVEHYHEISPLIKKDVESLLTYLSVDLPWKNDVTKHANLALYTKIVDIISKRLEKLAKSSNGYSDVWLSFARYIEKHVKECSFITLNYDVLLEHLLLKVFQKQDNDKYAIFTGYYNYPMAYVCERDGSVVAGSIYEGNLPPILKLHGSANWFWSGITPSETLYYRMWDEYETKRVLQGLKPYIIPPVMDKNAFYNHIAIRSLWQQAEKLLQETDEIYIIGFSFPETDFSVKYLFQSALRNSTAKVYVINVANYETELKNNYENVFIDIPISHEYTGNPKVTERFLKNLLKNDK